MLISFIIPTRRKSNDLPVLKSLKGIDNRVAEIIITRHHGVSRARNKGVELSKGDIIVFLEDDIEFDVKKLLPIIMKQEPGTITVLYSDGLRKYQIGRITIIRKNDWKITGGFDEYIKFGGEGQDWIIRSVLKGLKWKPIKFDYKHLSRPYSIWIEMKRYFYYTMVVIRWKEMAYKPIHKYFLPTKNLLVWLAKLFGFYYHFLHNIKNFLFKIQISWTT